MPEPNKLAQEEELAILRSIFGDDWKDIPPKKTAWGTESEQGWWEVALRGNEEPRVRIRLKGRFPKNYPATAPPLLYLLEPIKLTAEHVRKLQRALDEKAKSFVGGPAYIFDLTDFISLWMDKNHVPLPKPGEPEPTLMEEMAIREEAQRAAEEAQKQSEREHRLAAEAEQKRVLNERIQLDASRKEERVRQALIDQNRRQREERVSALADGEFEMRELVLKEPISVDGYQGKWAKWSVFAGRREQLWTSYTAEPVSADKDPNFAKVSTPTVTVQVVDFTNRYYNGAHGQKRIDTLISELSRLMEVRSPHVARVFAVEKTKSHKGWERLIVVVERVPEAGRLRTWLPKDGFGEDLAKEYMIQILEGLSECHNAYSMQKQLDCDLVLLSAGDDDDIRVKISGTGYAKRWSPDEIDAPYTYTPKRDIWQAGLVLLQMLFGRNCLWTYHDLPTLLQHAPGGVSTSVADLLKGMIQPVTRRRFTADEALKRLRAVGEETTTRPPRSLPMSQTASGTGIVSTASSFHPDLFSKSPGQGSFYYPPVPAGSLRYSRYRQDFEEVEFLGKGGFGEVVKARNKLDGRPYAIKKVKLSPEDDVHRVLREVNALSRVSHQYIVRYYSCWLEDVGLSDGPDGDDSSAIQSSVNSSAVNSSNASSESDIFAVKFDDFDKSISRRDLSKSASFPRIRFADDDDDDDDDDEENGDGEISDDDSDSDSSGWASEHTVADPSASVPRQTRTQPLAISKPSTKYSTSYTGTTDNDDSVQRILYIQMEFVEKQTLREAISAGLNEDECWRLLVQMLQALAHMSTSGIVHRDLKPSNILLDANGNVKIADFGLSTTDLPAADLPIGQMELSTEDVDRTSNIGTSSYIAPEADMYSLGVIFFEMCYAFKTGMERVNVLGALRSKDVVFPDEWPPSKMPKQREIISLLMCHDPSMRPQATQLLSGPLVPTINMGEQFYDSVIAEITNPRSEKYPALIDALFETDAKSKYHMDNRTEDYTYDNEHDDTLFSWQTVVNGRIKKLFRRHGAMEVYLPLLLPETTLLKPYPERSPVRLLDSGGRFVRLPSSNLVGMARSTSRQRIERIKRYAATQRYTELPAGGQPGTHTELCAVVDYEFHVSHESILAALLSTCPSQMRSKVLKAFKGPATGVAFGHSRPSLSSISGLPSNCIYDIEKVSPVDEFDAVKEVLEETYPQLRRKFAFAFEEIQTTIRLARSSGVKRKILFRPTLSKHCEYYRGGIMFECVRNSKHSEVLGYGGRHDSLLDHFKDPGIISRPVHGVNLSIASDMLTRMVRKQELANAKDLLSKKKNADERSFGVWAPNRCDVYVSSTSAVTIGERLAMCGQLWRAGIRADLQYDDGRTLQQVIEECMDQSILYVVIIRGHRDEAKVIRVLTGKNSEESVSEDKLVGWLRAAIDGQRRIDQAYADGTTPIVKNQAKEAQEQQLTTRVTNVEINLVLPPEPFTTRGVKNKATRKYRHGTKSVYYEKADEFAASVKSTLPVIGVDLAPDLLSTMALETAWITDDEAWRTLTQPALPNSERGYAAEVRRAVVEHAKSTGGCVWLFSVRDARGFLLQLPAAPNHR
ncbi:hypothetical protein CcaverHIS631_0305010 [Cutaneotrichosporon cavernicola]|nr:hypothetical protein CcaverHIS631_0305010 [Cutaneotrichosporon cavernicola]BEJ05978.1 hypothetical protein CcaverHIS641_0305000 [Cutaneotrichosporon cavernicola]